ncbi:hypothetical protein IM749_05170, partial [Moraxella sp. K2450]|nr:hypothetical protein [Moraxella sp. K2450]
MTTVASAQNNTPSINDINKKLESLATLQRIVQGAIGVHTENIKKNQTSIAKNKTTL